MLVFNFEERDSVNDGFFLEKAERIRLLDTRAFGG